MRVLPAPFHCISRRYLRGVTLVELLVVVAIAVVLAAVTIPNLSFFFINNRLSTAANEMVAALSSARSEALKRGATVTLRRVSATNRNWTDGWEMFVDNNASGARDAGEELLREGQRVADRVTVYSSEEGTTTALSFLPSGRVLFGTDGHKLFIICYDGQLAVNNQSRSRAVIASASGRIRVADSDASGHPISDLSGPVTSCTNPSF